MYNLTQREFDILHLLIKGLSNNEIAKELFISQHTVKVYVSSLIKKLNAKNRVEVLYIAIQNHLI